MGKQGPCYHCGVTSTPLWRNGPPEKPVLCNACGSRWRTKGSLANYTPLHARAEDDFYKDRTLPTGKRVSINRSKEGKTLKRKLNADSGVVRGAAMNISQGFRKVVDEDTSNKSSSGSAVSNSESCHFEIADRPELTGPLQPGTCETTFSSKKKICINHSKPSCVEKLAKDLYSILQEQQSSCLSESSEECLILESETPMVSVEIGYGSVLIKNPGSIAQEDESEASSISYEKKCSFNKASTSSPHSGIFSLFEAHKDEKFGRNRTHQEEQVLQDNRQPDKRQILENSSIPLSRIDLNDVLNLEEFLGRLTNEEQQKLISYLPLSDAAKSLDGLRNMFASPQFKENLSWFQKLLAEGVFDISSWKTKGEELEMLKELLLSDTTKSDWIESCQSLKKGDAGIPKANVSSNLQAVEGLNNSWDPNSSERKAATVHSSTRAATKPRYEHEESSETRISGFSSCIGFALSPFFKSSSQNSPSHLEDQDLLLDVPSSGSYPEAELLHSSQLADTS